MIKRVTKQEIEDSIAQVTFINLGEACSREGHGNPANYQTTICNIRLKNGFTVRGESACVDPAAYNKEIGESIAYENAFNSLWPLFGFALMDRTYRENQTAKKDYTYDQIVEAASKAHAGNCRIQEKYGEVVAPEWDDLSDYLVQSTINGVKAIIDNPEITAEDLHASWSQERISDGWVYGADKCTVAKTHPCLVPYAELPEFQREKDYSFRSIVKESLGMV